MQRLVIFIVLLMVTNRVHGDPPECLPPDSEDTEMLIETVAGGPVRFLKSDMLYFTPANIR